MQRLTAFHGLLDSTIASTWADNDYLMALSKGAETLAENIKSVGDSAYENLEEGFPEREPLADYFLHFEWAEQAKNFLILWRDILFEQQKAELIQLDKKLGAEGLASLKSSSFEAVQNAAEFLKNFPGKKLSTIKAKQKGEKKQLDTWKLQINPWPKYRSQIENLKEQCQELIDHHQKLEQDSISLQSIRSLIDETVIFCQSEIKEFKDTAEQTESFVNANGEEPGKVANHLEELEANLKMTSYASTFNHALDEKISDLEEKTQVPVSVRGGLIQQREIFFQRRTRQWLESEVLPLLYEVWELTERTGNSLKMSLVNIRNRAILLSKNEGEPLPSQVDFTQPIDAFVKNAIESEKEVAELKALIDRRLSADFEFSALYRADEFLPVPLQSTIEQMRLDQSPLLAKGREWIDKINNRLRQARTDVVQESVLSLSEKIVRFVQEQTPDVENSQYSNIFLTKGYIGESFVVGRKNELAHVRKIVDNWRQGFRGAVILSGRRFSGKSLFGELVANRHFIGHTIRISPNSSLQVGSRRITTTTDLGEALNFIEKHTLNERQLIWLDDLELWGDANISLSQNVRRLIRSIDSLSDRLFFLVSMSSWSQRHLSRFHDLNHVFQAEVNLDRMSSAEIRQAILIRHGATHRNLVDSESKEVTPQQFQKMTERIFKSSRGNIGDALNQWCANTHRVDEERVSHTPGTGNTLPNFLRPDNRLLLRSLLLEKRTNEYRLRRLFGPAFKERYGGILQRLIHTGLLTRQMDGWLEINEVAVNEVGRMVFSE